MIKYGNLLSLKDTPSIFWRTVLERLSILDAPFYSKITGSCLNVNFSTIDIENQPPQKVIDFCRQQWELPDPVDNWKDIKKENVRLILIKNYVNETEPNHLKRKNLMLKISMMINKLVKNDDIELRHGKIVFINLKRL